MIKRRLFSLPPTLCMVVLCAACGADKPPTNQAPPETAPPTSAAPEAPETAAPNPPVDARVDSTATLTVPASDSAAVLLGRLHQQNQKMTVRVPVQNKQKLTATLLVSDANSNVRFNQLVYPGGKSDGPFGSTISVPTPQNGDYQLIIGHNQMREGSAAQEFKLRVTLAQ